jgi:hypothetical protein
MSVAVEADPSTIKGGWDFLAVERLIRERQEVIIDHGGLG